MTIRELVFLAALLLALAVSLALAWSTRPSRWRVRDREPPFDAGRLAAFPVWLIVSVLLAGVTATILTFALACRGGDCL